MRNFTKLRSEKGSITLFVLTSMLFFVMIIFLLYSGMENKINAQKKELDIITKEYEQFNMEQEYNQAKERIARNVNSGEGASQSKETIEYLQSAYASENTVVVDSNGNEIIIPKGFKITNDTKKVNEGMVITDGTNEFVWIPCRRSIRWINNKNDKA